MIQSFDGASLPSLGLGSVVKRHAAGVLMCFAWLTGNAAVQSTTAQDPVIESLGPRIGVAVALPTNEAARLLAVSQAIDMAHKSADARLLGQAQGLIGPDWNNPQASAEIKLLQATIQQHRHEFPEALTTLREVTARSEAQSPTALQAWLTIAVIERVQGRYEAALQACQHLVGPTVLLYRLGCVAETQSLQGQVAAAQKGFKAALAVARTASQQGWIRSLIAEHEVRQGNTEQAARNFASSLASPTTTPLWPIAIYC
jgi:tetratricopeptide (TPR) repeat protein